MHRARRAPAGIATRRRSPIPSSPMAAGKIKISSMSVASHSSRLRRTLAKTPPATASRRWPCRRSRLRTEAAIFSSRTNWIDAADIGRGSYSRANVTIALCIARSEAKSLPISSVIIDPENGDRFLRRQAVHGAETGKPRELAFVPVHPVAQSAWVGVAVGQPQNCFRTAIAAAAPTSASSPNRHVSAPSRAQPVAVVDIIAAPIGRVDQRIVPVGMKERRQAVREMMIAEENRNAVAQAQVAQQGASIKTRQKPRQLQLAGSSR